jgi:hypothetical protein
MILCHSAPLLCSLKLPPSKVRVLCLLPVPVRTPTWDAASNLQAVPQGHLAVLASVHGQSLSNSLPIYICH